MISNGRIIGIISEGVFKKSNAGGFTTILLFQKKIKRNYNIFFDSAEKIGFDQTRKNAPKI